MTRNEKLNALTRLALLSGFVLYYFQYEYWLTFLLFSIGSIIIAKYALPENKEGFSMPPTYNAIDHQETVLAPVYAEEWQIPPVEYDLVDGDYTDPLEGYGPFSPKNFGNAGGSYGRYGPDDSAAYVELKDLGRFRDNLEYDPYGQYLTRTNQMPGDEIEERKLTSLKDARAYANDAFTRHRNSFQEDMIRLYKKKIARRYKQNLYTVSSAYDSRN